MPSYVVQWRTVGPPAGNWSTGTTVNTGATRSGSLAVTGLTNDVAYEFRVVLGGVNSRNTKTATPSAAYLTITGTSSVEASASSGGTDSARVLSYNDGTTTRRGVLVCTTRTGGIAVDLRYRDTGGNLVTTPWVSKSTSSQSFKVGSGSQAAFFFPFASAVAPATEALVAAAKVHEATVTPSGGTAFALNLTII